MPEGTDPNPSTETGSDTGKAPKWEGDFDADRAARLVQNLRADLDKLKSERDEIRTKLTAREDAEKTELQKAIERAEKAEAAARKHSLSELRRTVAKAAELPDGWADHLTGDSEAEMTAKAAAIAALLGQSKPSSPGEELSTKPKPRLVPGHGAGNDDADFDPMALADSIRSGF